jgi:PPK2 family polyphosphate:nucleotide phosphotransferase
VQDLLVVRPGEPANLSGRASDDALGFDKARATVRRQQLVERLSDLQTRLYAEQERALVLVLQGLDTSGKDGTIRRVFTGVNPSGCRVVSFKAPAGSELQHDYLRRVHQQVPQRGMIGVFNRSHYEDVVTASVLGVVDRRGRKRRCRHVRAFERMLHDEGFVLVKVFLHLGLEEQRRRLVARLADPEKHWKFDPADLAARALWDEYMGAYEDAITDTSTSWAPWHVVPADRKWASSLAVAELVVGRLEAMNPQPPEPKADLADVVIM